MRKILCSAILLAAFFVNSPAQGTIIQNFGTGANAFSIDFVTIGNPGNKSDKRGSLNPVGSVIYTYNIGKYEVSREMIEKANAAGGLGITLQDMTRYGGNGSNKPATGISWYEAAKFVNYLNTSQGKQSAYKFDGGGNFQLWSSGDAGYDVNNKFRNKLAKFFLPSVDEWYKSAYGSPSGTWYNYPTGSDAAPTAVSGGTSGAVYYEQSGPAEITWAGGLSPYGTMAQGGNVWEWNESAYDGINDTVGESRVLRGGSWFFPEGVLSAGICNFSSPTNERYEDNGFRVASVSDNYDNVYTTRFIDVRQAKPSAPAITSYKMWIELFLSQKDSVTSLRLETPAKKKYSFRPSPYRGDDNRWDCNVNSGSSVKKYLNEFPAGKYLIRCLGGKLYGQTVEFNAELNLLNPIVPYLEADSFRLLSSRKIKVNQDNIITIRKLQKNDSPFLTVPSESDKDYLLAQIYLNGYGDGPLVYTEGLHYNTSGTTTLTIPAGTLKKNSKYVFMLIAYYHLAETGSAATPEGEIRSYQDGITYYELVFKTSK